jgi:hypothetical protein
MIRGPQFGSLNHGTIGSLKPAGIAMSPIQPRVCFRGEAEMGRQAKTAESVENDPSATSAAKFAMMHKTALAQGGGRVWSSRGVCEAKRIHYTCRQCDSMAAYGARATADDAGDRVPRFQIA